MLQLDDRIRETSVGVGTKALSLVRELYPIGRSITGAGLRTTVERLSRVVPLTVNEVTSGTQVFDWTVPDEWTIDEAFIEHESGRRFADLRQSSLHVVGYSTPVDTTMSLAELRPRLHTLPDHPDWIPYRTSYYSRTWGFCLPQRVVHSLPEGQYRVVIRSTLAAGSMTVAEYTHRGASDREVLIFAHDCHPSLANDNLSGIAVAIHLAAFLAGQSTRYSYRFVFAPTTIGSIAWMATNEAGLHRIQHGLVLSLLGDAGPLRYKQTRLGGHAIDRAAWHVLKTEFDGAQLLPFSPWGYDERQFCSPGINLPVGRLTRTPNGEFPEYHTSGDNPDFLSAASLGQAWLACLRIFEAIEADGCYVNQSPKGEPQFGRRGLSWKPGGTGPIPDGQLALLWMLNQSDGRVSFLEIAEKSGLRAGVLARAATDLEAAGLLVRQKDGSHGN